MKLLECQTKKEKKKPEGGKGKFPSTSHYRAMKMPPTCKLLKNISMERGLLICLLFVVSESWSLLKGDRHEF